MEFSLHHHFDELEGLASGWNGLLSASSTHVPFLRFEYLRAWWQTRGGGEWPHAELVIISAHKGDRLVGIAPLFSSPNLEGDSALLLLGSIEISDYLDVIAYPESLPGFLSGLLEFISPPSRPGGNELPLAGLTAWKVLDWHNIPAESPTLPALKKAAEQRGFVYTQQQTYHAPSIPLKGDFEAYLAGIDKKQRHEIRRKMRRLEESGLEHRWYFASEAVTLEAEVEAFLDMMASDPAKANFLTASMRTQMQMTCRAAFDAGWLQLAFLDIEGRKAAGYLNFDYQDRIWVYNSGIDAHFGEYSPGWVLLGYLLRWANEHQRSEFDFMRGNEAYKYRFGGVDHLLVRAKVSR